MQVKLLRVLQERTYEPLGSTRSEQADVRVITATNRDLAERMQEGAFREDLYYRLNVVRIELPPLRRRKEDIPLLVDQFVTHFNRLRKTNVLGIKAEALSLLMAHDWPGKRREVENAIEHAFILCHEGYIDIRHLPEELRAHGSGTGLGSDIRSAHDILDGQAIRIALERNAFNRAAAARTLGIHKTTLFRQMKRLGITPPKQDGRKRRSK